MEEAQEVSEALQVVDEFEAAMKGEKERCPWVQAPLLMEESWWAALQELGESIDRSVSGLIRDAVGPYLDSHYPGWRER